jgi:hypothetical protein
LHPVPSAQAPYKKADKNKQARKPYKPHTRVFPVTEIRGFLIVLELKNSAFCLQASAKKEFANDLSLINIIFRDIIKYCAGYRILK